MPLLSDNMYNKAGFIEKAVFVAAGSWPIPPAVLERGCGFAFRFCRILGFLGMAPFGSMPKAAETGQAAGHAARRRRYIVSTRLFFIGFNTGQS
jgi:hypothetical protein